MHLLCVVLSHSLHNVDLSQSDKQKLSSALTDLSVLSVDGIVYFPDRRIRFWSCGSDLGSYLVQTEERGKIEFHSN